MAQPERFETLILGCGNGGMFLAWHMAQSGRRTAVVERRLIGGSCPNTNCLPSKNEIWSAKVADLVHHGARFGAKTGSVAIDMAKVRQRKRGMVEEMIELTLQQYESSGAELIMGTGHFVAPKTLEVRTTTVAGRACSRAIRFSSISERTRRFRTCPASMRQGRLRTSRRWNSTMCRNI
jgi:pyruvate/2-oxoglutarate dehydrogenase complex dihydrolipoamide dehydrogenase (E3) component